MVERLAGGVGPGRTLKSYAPSGPAGGYLPASMLDLPLDWNAITAAGATVSSGAVVVCDDRACMLDMAPRNPKGPPTATRSRPPIR